jgi:hypothetical protein
MRLVRCWQTDVRRIVRSSSRALKEQQHAFEAKLAELAKRLKMRSLPIPKTWREESVTYETRLVCYEGSVFQAKKDTTQRPGGSERVCLVLARRDGRGGITPSVRGPYDVRKKYAHLDIVFDGTGFIARYDNPGLHRPQRSIRLGPNEVSPTFAFRLPPLDA